jgi:hypothetical protein
MKINSLVQPDIIGIYVGIIGIILASVFYFRSKEKVRPRMLIEKTSLIGERESFLPESVEIRYSGEVIPMLSKARITFWNAGRKTLNDIDVAKHDPICLRLAESKSKLLDIRSVTTTRDVINARVTREANVILILFDFLDRDDGLALEAFYDGDLQTELSIAGTIKGVRSGIAVRVSTNLSEEPESSFFSRNFLSLAGASILGAAIGLLVIAFDTKNKVDWLPVLYGIIFSIFGVGVIMFNIYNNFYRRIPRHLRIAK